MFVRWTIISLLRNLGLDFFPFPTPHSPSVFLTTFSFPLSWEFCICYYWMLGSQRKELVTNGPLCLLHFSQSQTKPFIFNLKTTKDPSLFNLTWSSYECLQTTYFTCFCEETPLRGFANKKPPAYHWWVKIPTSILNSIHFVNHQDLYSPWLWINILK